MPWRDALGSGQRVLVSGFGKWGGGIYDISSGAPIALDDLPTSGLAVGGARLWRVLRAPGEQTSTCELLSYDERGVRSYQRIDDVRDPHDLCWHDEAVHVASAWDSAVWRIRDNGAARIVWQGSHVPDGWHINGLVAVDGRLHVSGFGRFERFKGWKEPARHGRRGVGSQYGAGFLYDIERDVDVITGLRHPHSPQQVNGRWYVCESATGSLLECDVHGEVLRRSSIGRFSRGLAIVDDWALVGGNARRGEAEDRGEIVVVDLDDFEIVDKLEMPCLEMYDIVAVPTRLARGVAVGFGANPTRAVGQFRQYGRPKGLQPTPPEAQLRLVPGRVVRKLAEVGEVLDPKVAARCRVEAKLPRDLDPGETMPLTISVENRSPLALATLLPRPIRVGAYWIRSGPGSVAESATLPGPEQSRPATMRNPLAPLPRLLHPGETVEVEILLEAPGEPGIYEVRVALFQPGRGRFGRRVEGVVQVNETDEAQSASGRRVGNSTTSRIDGVSVSSITRRSMPMPNPPVGGRP